MNATAKKLLNRGITMHRSKALPGQMEIRLGGPRGVLLFNTHGKQSRSDKWVAERTLAEVRMLLELEGIL